ncbi:MAG: box helicase domain protein [Frankiales bacterium]|nr:box helicase domain protein [Frankiales bacterium]
MTTSRFLLDRLLADLGEGVVTHVHHIPPRTGEPVDWPLWVPAPVRDRLVGSGITLPWSHQAEAAGTAWSGEHVVCATGTASGKSLAYQLPVFAAARPDGRGPTALYLSPTKALAADQFRRICELDMPGVRATTYDGDTSREMRAWARQHANLLLTNPDMLHHAMLPGHERWGPFLRRLQYVVIDECHSYRGVFGSHVGLVIRRLRRIAERYGASPVFVLASATVSEPAESASRLIGAPVRAVTDDGSPRGAVDVVLCEPPFGELTGEGGVPLRRSATSVAAGMLVDLAIDEVRTVAFVRSRRGAEAVAASARRSLAEVAPELENRVAAYRGGYLPEERRALERALLSGELLGVAATTALELGVDVAGLDAVLMVGYPGRLSSFWQQAGRAGRAGGDSLVALVARDEPLDAYLVHHPEALLGRPIEATVFDVTNPYVLGPHLCAAAQELPLAESDAAFFGADLERLAYSLTERGWLRRRATGWFWTKRERASDMADLRGSGGSPIRLVDARDGRLLGTVDNAASHSTAHPGAIYLHQGEPFLVQSLDLDECVALVGPGDPELTTSAREVTQIAVVETSDAVTGFGTSAAFGVVDVTNQVVAFQRRRLLSGEVLGEEPLDLPARNLRTRAVWWTVSDAVLAAAGIGAADVPGSAHGAEHASIGLLPLFASCDRWDIGGVSTARHPDTGELTVFVYDGHPGGAGFAERGYGGLLAWLTATRDAIAECRCETGCPSCVQSPKCGNGNNPLDKDGAVILLSAFLERQPARV